MLRHSTHFRFFLSFVLLLFAVASPCSCFANTSSKVEQQTAHEHSCCDKQTDKQTSESQDEQNDCDSCPDCAGMKNFVPENAAKILSFDAPLVLTALTSPHSLFPGRAEDSGYRPLAIQRNRPPGISITSSAVLSRLLHRWRV